MEIIAHRGASRAHRENTLPAFGRALADGADGIELDVHVLSDGEVVVHHDETLPLPDGRPLAALTLADLDARGVAQDDPQHVPRLADVLALVAGRCTVYVEVKAAAALDPVLALLRGREQWTAVHGFDHRVARAARAAAPGLPVGVLSASYLLDPARVLREVGARDYWQHRDLVDRDLVSAVHGAGGRLVVWTENDPGRMRRLRDLGVDAVCTDVPDVARDALA